VSVRPRGGWDEIRIQEIINYATYDQPTVIFDTMGFGSRWTPPRSSHARHARVRVGRHGPLLAEGLGVELDEIRQSTNGGPREAVRIGARTVAPERWAPPLRGAGHRRRQAGDRRRARDPHRRRPAPDWPQGRGSYRVSSPATRVCAASTSSGTSTATTRSAGWCSRNAARERDPRRVRGAGGAAVGARSAADHGAGAASVRLRARRPRGSPRGRHAAEIGVVRARR
jgi:hypothetical protein